MAIAFPATPSVDDTYTYEGKTWVWNGVGWAAVLVQSFELTVSATEPVTPTEGDLWLDIS